MRELATKDLQQFVRQLKQLVRRDIAHLRNTADVARRYGMHRSTLQRRWKRSGEQMPLGKFIRIVRCEAAVAVHRANPDASCKEVAVAVGYASSELASRHFRRYTGVTMRQALLTDQEIEN